MELPFLVEACDLFVYLNVHSRSYQFEEVVSTQIFIRLCAGSAPVNIIVS